MIPLKLTLKNFLSYGQTIQEIDFTPYRFICLSGKNGHGKSALLDAITWAIWGQARKISGTSKADSGLLRLGQTQMMVTLEFICNNQKYKVRREYAHTYGKPYAALDFSIIQDDSSFISLTNKTIRATQEKINKTLSLTFDTFINSAFLRQGHSNEFSQKSPKDRKQVFAEILGLHKYEEIKKKALEKVKFAAAQKISLENFNEKLKTEIEKTKTIETNLQEISENLNTIKLENKEKKTSLQKLEKQEKNIINQKQKKSLLDFQIKELLSQQKKINLELVEIQKKSAQYKKQKSLNIDEKQFLQEKHNIQKHIKKMQEQLQEKLLLKEQLFTYKTKLHERETQINSDYNIKVQKEEKSYQILQNNCKTLEQKLKTIDNFIDEKTKSCKDIALIEKKLDARINKNKEIIKNYISEEKHFLKRKEYYQSYIIQGNFLKKELLTLEKKEAITSSGSNPSCPLCDQNLSESHKQSLEKKFSEKRKFLTHRFNRFSTVIKKLKTILIDQHQRLEKYKKIENETIELTAQNKELQKQSLHLQQEIGNGKKEHKKIKLDYDSHKQEHLKSENILNKLQENKNNILKNSSDYTWLLKKYKQCAKKLENNHFNQTQYNAYNQKLSYVEKKLESLQSLIAQKPLQEERIKKIKKLTVELSSKSEHHEKLTKELIVYKDLPLQEEVIIKEKKTLLLRIKNNEEKNSKLLQEKGRFENELQQLKKYKKDFESHNKKLLTLQEEIDDYQTIAQATGKNGVQALLIENTIPEVEKEANYLLSKLTDNQAQIYIESLRDLKKGGTKETLDIKISDEMGIRPYELFSGGEAFRIDFIPTPYLRACERIIPIFRSK